MIMSEAETNNSKRYLTILSLLTFIGAGIGFIFALLYVLLWMKMGPMIEKGDESAIALKQTIVKAIGQKEWNLLEAENNLAIYYDSMRNHYIAVVFSNLLAILAVVLLRYKKAYGFYIYIFSHLLFLLSPFLIIHHFKPQWGETFIFAVVAALFIGLYYKSFREISLANKA